MNDDERVMTMSTYNNRRSYSKPSINKIKLVAEEAVLAQCKWNTGAGNRALCMPDRTCVATPRS